MQSTLTKCHSTYEIRRYIEQCIKIPNFRKIKPLAVTRNAHTYIFYSCIYIYHLCTTSDMGKYAQNWSKPWYIYISRNHMFCEYSF